MKVGVIFFVVIFQVQYVLLNAQSVSFTEKYRPQLHFSPKQNWMNDPCGNVYFDGEYHLFYQYNPFNRDWGPMYWGHAVSPDMISWEHLPIAILPNAKGYIWSGCIVIDSFNTAGFNKNNKPAMIALFTQETGGKQSQAIAYSTDNGRTFTHYALNPVIGYDGSPVFRDPAVFWHHESSKWIMLFSGGDHVKFYSSANLKEWTKLSEFGEQYGAHGGVWECPDLFQLPVEGSDDKKWVLVVGINPGAPAGGSGTQYFIGNFNGTGFVLEPELEGLLKDTAIIPTGIVFDDFENDYQNWTIEGAAFGAEPVTGTLPNQQKVSGFLGNKLVNSYLNGDGSTGKMISKNFVIENHYIYFFIGGGKNPGETAIQLKINGNVALSETGNNEEKLILKCWDVSQYIGLEACFEIIDMHTSGWGHINIDHIVFSDEYVKPKENEALWLDFGPDFYAARSWQTANNQRSIIAWMTDWSYAGIMPTSPWRGAMTYPRLLRLIRQNSSIRLSQELLPINDSLKNGHVAFNTIPISELNNYLTNNSVEFAAFEVKLEKEITKNDTIEALFFINSGKPSITVGFNSTDNKLYIDRANACSNCMNLHYRSRYETILEEADSIKLHILIDASSVEVVANNGEKAITCIVFPTHTSNEMQLFYSGNGSDEIKFERNTCQSIWPKVTNVNEIENSGLLNIYPNPASDFLNVGVPGSNVENLVFTIVSSSGNRFNVNKVENITNNLYRLCINNMPNGTYILHVTSEVGSYSNVFMKKM